MEALKKASFKEKDKNELPKGAKVINKETSIRVEEIENGFLLTKSIEIKYKMSDRDYNDYYHSDKKYFSKENPLEVDLEKVGEKSLADNFN